MNGHRSHRKRQRVFVSLSAGWLHSETNCRLFPCVAINAKFNAEATWRAEFDRCPAVIAYRTANGARGSTSRANDLT